MQTQFPVNLTNEYISYQQQAQQNYLQLQGQQQSSFAQQLQQSMKNNRNDCNNSNSNSNQLQNQQSNSQSNLYQQSGNNEKIILSKYLEEYHPDKVALQKQVTYQSEEISQLRQQNDQLRTENSMLKKQITQLTAQNDILKDTISLNNLSFKNTPKLIQNTTSQRSNINGSSEQVEDETFTAQQSETNKSHSAYNQEKKNDLSKQYSLEQIEHSYQAQVKLIKNKYELEINDLKKQVRVLHSEMSKMKDTADEKSMKLYELVLTLEREKQELQSQNMEFMKINAYTSQETQEDGKIEVNQFEQDALTKSENIHQQQQELQIQQQQQLGLQQQHQQQIQQQLQLQQEVQPELPLQSISQTQQQQQQHQSNILNINTVNQNFSINSPDTLSSSSTKHHKKHHHINCSSHKKDNLLSEYSSQMKETSPEKENFNQLSHKDQQDFQKQIFSAQTSPKFNIQQYSQQQQNVQKLQQPQEECQIKWHPEKSSQQQLVSSKDNSSNSNEFRIQNNKNQQVQGSVRGKLHKDKSVKIISSNGLNQREKKILKPNSSTSRLNQVNDAFCTEEEKKSKNSIRDQYISPISQKSKLFRKSLEKQSTNQSSLISSKLVSPKIGNGSVTSSNLHSSSSWNHSKNIFNNSCATNISSSNANSISSNNNNNKNSCNNNSSSLNNRSLNSTKSQANLLQKLQQHERNLSTGADKKREIQIEGNNSKKDNKPNIQKNFYKKQKQIVKNISSSNLKSNK